MHQKLNYPALLVVEKIMHILYISSLHNERYQGIFKLSLFSHILCHDQWLLYERGWGAQP